VRFITENLGWKLTSFALAFLLWLVFVGHQEMTTSILGPVQLRAIPPDLEVSSDIPERVNLIVRGNSGTLSNLTILPVVLDLQHVDGPGERTFNIEGGSEVDLPPAVRLDRAVPSQIRLRLERRESREIPVRVRFAGPAPDGYQVSRYEVRPQVVKVVGPQSRVQLVEFAETDPLDLTGVYQQKEFRVNVFVDDPRVRLAETAQVVVRAFIEKTGEEPAAIR
jgi:YbbR domain-containing protein